MLKKFPKEIPPSSFECDCGHQSHFFENTIKEMKAMTLRKEKKEYLDDGEGHTIVFQYGEMIEILCPRKPTHARKTLSKNQDKEGKKTILENLP